MPDRLPLERLRLCVTFGTPHEGAALAVAPEECVEWFIAAQEWWKTTGKVSIKDILTFHDEHERFPGVEDLRTVDDDDRPDDNKFQVQLKKLEGSYPKIRVFAVGGNTDGQLPDLNDVGQRIGRAFTQHALGRRDHDWVVGVKSSMPITWPQEDQLETICNHFRYFQPEQDAVLTYVARLLESELGIAPARASRVKR